MTHEVVLHVDDEQRVALGEAIDLRLVGLRELEEPRELVEERAHSSKSIGGLLRAMF